MTRAEKRAAIMDALREDPSRSDRAIGQLAGVDGKTVATLRLKLRTAEIETPHSDQGAEIGARGAEIETPQSGEAAPDAEICPVCGEIEFLHDPAMRTPGAVAEWFLRILPDAPVDRIIAALRRRVPPAATESEITIPGRPELRRATLPAYGRPPGSMNSGSILVSASRPA